MFKPGCGYFLKAIKLRAVKCSLLCLQMSLFFCVKREDLASP